VPPDGCAETYPVEGFSGSSTPLSTRKPASAGLLAVLRQRWNRRTAKPASRQISFLLNQKSPFIAAEGLLNRCN
jgi:hypothetical protein